MELAHQARNGSDHAAQLLFELYAPRLVARAESSLRGGYLGMNVSDVVQTTLRRAYAALPYFEPAHEHAVGAWFERILENAVRDRRRRRMALKRDCGAMPLSLDGLGIELCAGKGSGEGSPEDREIAGIAWGILDDDERRLLRSRILDGLSWKEVAQACGIPEAEVARKRFSKVRAKLALRLKPKEIG